MSGKITIAIKTQLDKHVKFDKAAHLPKFFKAIPGGYGEGDQFLGVVVPDQRKIARRFYKEIDDIELAEIVDPGLTTVHVPHRQMGTSAAQMIIALLKGETLEPRPPLATRIVTRASLGAPNHE